MATISPTDAASFLTPRQAEAGAVDGGALAVATALDVAGVTHRLVDGEFKALFVVGRGPVLRQ